MTGIYTRLIACSRNLLEEEDLLYALWIAVDGFCESSKLLQTTQLHRLHRPVSRRPSQRIARIRPSLGSPFIARQVEFRFIDHVDQFTPGEDRALEGVRLFCLRILVRILVDHRPDGQVKEFALRLLVSQRIDVYVIHVLSQEEINPEVQGDLRLVDSEDQDQAEVTISRPLLQKYERTLELSECPGFQKGNVNHVSANHQPSTYRSTRCPLPSAKRLCAMSSEQSFLGWGGSTRFSR